MIPVNVIQSVSMQYRKVKEYKFEGIEENILVENDNKMTILQKKISRKRVMKLSIIND